MSDTVLYSTKNGIATISLYRPKRLNAINSELLKTLHDAIQAANDDDNVRVILLRGEGRAFCAGADLKERSLMTKEESIDAVYLIKSLIVKILNFPSPAIKPKNPLAIIKPKLIVEL